MNEEFLTVDSKLQRKCEDSHPVYEIQHPTLPASCLLIGPKTDVYHTSIKLEKLHAFMKTEAQRRKQLHQQQNQTARMYQDRCEDPESKVQQYKLLLAKQKVQNEGEKWAIRNLWRNELIEGCSRASEWTDMPLGKAIYTLKMNNYSYKVISYHNYSCMYNVMNMYTVCYNDKLNFLSLPTV